MSDIAFFQREKTGVQFKTTDGGFFGAMSDDANTGAVDTTTGVMAYLKQLVGGVKRVVTASSASPLTSGDIFTVDGGLVRILEIVGRVTTVVQAQATTVKLTHDPDSGGSNVDLSAAATDLNAKDVGTLIRLNHDFSDSLLISADQGDAIEGNTVDAGTILGSGDILVTFGAASTGAIAWTIVYESLGGEITAS